MYDTFHSLLFILFNAGHNPYIDSTTSELSLPSLQALSYRVAVAAAYSDHVRTSYPVRSAPLSEDIFNFIVIFNTLRRKVHTSEAHVHDISQTEHTRYPVPTVGS